MNALVLSLATLISTITTDTMSFSGDNKYFSAQEITALQKMGGKVTPQGDIELGGIVLNPKTKEISFQATTQITSGILEVLIATPKGRGHEAVINADIDPFHLQMLCYLSGMQNGTRKGKGQGALYRIEVEPKDGGKRPIEEWICVVGKKVHEPIRDWVFVGSTFQNGECLASREGNIVLLWSYGQSIFDNPQTDGDVDDNFEVFAENIPPEAHRSKIPVRIILTPAEMTKTQSKEKKNTL